ncbi:MAG: molybdopterin-dependent oxidoreductase [Gammaproteobacteria bacterium]
MFATEPVQPSASRASGRTPDHASAKELEPEQLVAAIAADPSLLDNPQLRQRHENLLAHASVCSYCGVGCPYTVEQDARGKPRIYPLSPLGLCVKGKTSLLTGGDKERAQRLAKRGLPDDRIRAPMLRGHDGQMREVSWDEALDRAAWLFLHAREWVGPEAVAVYGNGQKTIEAIWMASLYKLVFKLPTMGANSEHCLTSAVRRTPLISAMKRASPGSSLKNSHIAMLPYCTVRMRS